MTATNLTIGLIVLLSILPLAALAVAYRAWRRASMLEVRIDRVEEDLAFWRETGGRLLESAARESDGAANDPGEHQPGDKQPEGA